MYRQPQAGDRVGAGDWIAGGRRNSIRVAFVGMAHGELAVMTRQKESHLSVRFHTSERHLHRLGDWPLLSLR